MITVAVLSGGESIPVFGGAVGIGFPFFVGDGDGVTVMEEVVVGEAINEAVVIGIFEFWGNC